MNNENPNFVVYLYNFPLYHSETIINQLKILIVLIMINWWWSSLYVAFLRSSYANNDKNLKPGYPFSILAVHCPYKEVASILHHNVEQISFNTRNPPRLFRSVDCCIAKTVKHSLKKCPYSLVHHNLLLYFSLVSSDGLKKKTRSRSFSS